eukprot:TRINITY_DN20198_c1_g1_i1.p1 TRINITY_DN20198_c1_g1~~TRINITY_DN20198_c1_g1_i1.p1  ORF type:complete len:348 (+),score=30.23 TRINITY_DN20198_c1_g1_i1:40-1083(+)
MKRVNNYIVRWYTTGRPSGNDRNHRQRQHHPQRTDGQHNRRQHNLHQTRVRNHQQDDRRRPSPKTTSTADAYSNVIDDSWKSDSLTNGARHKLSWAERPVPGTHQWKKPVIPQGARGAKIQSELLGVWNGRPEDELKIPSGWKGGGGPWTWRVFDSECEVDANGLDVSRVRQTKPWCCAHAGALLTKGKHEWEIRLTGNTRAARVGVALPSFSIFDNLAWGPETTSSWVMTDLGSLWHNEKLVARCAPYRKSKDVVKMTCDMDEGTLSFTVNGTDGERNACFEFIPSDQGVLPVVCFRERPVTAELRHIFSSDVTTDTGPYYQGKPIVRGQIKDVPKRDPNGLLPYV